MSDQADLLDFRDVKRPAHDGQEQTAHDTVRPYHAVRETEVEDAKCCHRKTKPRIRYRLQAVSLCIRYTSAINWNVYHQAIPEIHRCAEPTPS